MFCLQDAFHNNACDKVLTKRYYSGQTCSPCTYIYFCIATAICNESHDAFCDDKMRERRRRKEIAKLQNSHGLMEALHSYFIFLISFQR